MTLLLPHQSHPRTEMSLSTRAASGAEASSRNEVVKPALSQAVGYVVVVVIGLVIAFSLSKSLRISELIADLIFSHDVCYQTFEENCRRRQQEDRNVRLLRRLILIGVADT